MGTSVILGVIVFMVQIFMSHLSAKITLKCSLLLLCSASYRYCSLDSALFLLLLIVMDIFIGSLGVTWQERELIFQTI